MKNITQRITVLTLIVLLFTTGIQADEGNPQKDKSSHRIPIATEPNLLTTTATGIAPGLLPSLIPEGALIPIVHLTNRQNPRALNSIKGEFGEALMDNIFTSKFVSNLFSHELKTITPNRNTRGNGIDGIYLGVDSNGNIIPNSIKVVDAKYNKSRLSSTKNGRQLSKSWTKPHLQQTANDYANIASRDVRMFRSASLPKGGNYSRVYSIPINEKTNAFVWYGSEGEAYFYSPESNITSDLVRSSAQKVAIALTEAAEGKINYETYKFSIKIHENKYVIQFSEIDSNGLPVGVENSAIEDAFENLDVEIQEAIRKAYRSALRSIKYPEERINEMVEHLCETPEDFNRLCIKYQRKELLAKGTWATSIGTLLAVGIDVYFQILKTGKVNLKQTAIVSAASVPSILSGYLVTSPIQQIAVKAGLSKPFASLLGKTGGGFLSVAVFSYGLYFAGFSTLSEASTNFAVGSAITAVSVLAVHFTPAIMMAIAVNFGTTSTGVAISTLSGAAATNAALAWLGGGALVSGGGGIAGGVATISLVGGAVGIITVVACLGWETWSYFSSFEDQKAALSRKINSARRGTEATRFNYQ